MQCSSVRLNFAQRSAQMLIQAYAKLNAGTLISMMNANMQLLAVGIFTTTLASRASLWSSNRLSRVYCVRSYVQLTTAHRMRAKREHAAHHKLHAGGIIIPIRRRWRSALAKCSNICGCRVKSGVASLGIMIMFMICAHQAHWNDACDFTTDDFVHESKTTDTKKNAHENMGGKTVRVPSE